MILAVDVHYAADKATAAGVIFRAWTVQTPQIEVVSSSGGVPPYESGQFFISIIQHPPPQDHKLPTRPGVLKTLHRSIAYPLAYP